MNILGIVNDPLPAGYRVEVSDEGSPMKSATSTAGASLSQLNSPTLSPREVTGWGRGRTDVASPDHWEDYGGSLFLHNPPIFFPKTYHMLGLSGTLWYAVFVLLCYCQNELNQIWLQACFSVSLTSSRQNCNVTQDFIFIFFLFTRWF